MRGSVAGCEVAGISATAEGILSGDWWDAIPRPTTGWHSWSEIRPVTEQETVFTALRTRDLLRI